MNLSTLQVAGAAICGVCALLLVATWWLAPRIRSALDCLPAPVNDDGSPDEQAMPDALSDFLLLIELQDRLVARGHIDLARELDSLFPRLRWQKEIIE